MSRDVEMQPLVDPSVPADDGALAELAGRVATALRARGQCLGTAESCTGGWIAKVCTDLAGSSDWFEGGVVSYSNALKQSLLGVDAWVLDTEGAVSAACAGQMAAGALSRLDTDWAVAVTGIAGPAGGSPEKPVGLVWFGWQARGGEARVRAHRFAGDREAVRRQTVAMALTVLLEMILLKTGKPAV